jgi:prevent-host-death family protein
MTTTTLAHAKARLSAVVTSVQETHERVVLTKNGEPAAVIMSVDDLESLEETLALLSDNEARQHIRQAEADLDAGLGVELTTFPRSRP